MTVLQGRVAVVTGGARSIGLACSAALLRVGTRVIIADKDDDVAQTTAANLNCEAWAVDVSDPSQVERLAIHLRQGYGRVDILVNNAGIYPRRRFLEMTLDDWRQIMAVNLDGVFLCCKAFVPLMIEHGWGRIINIASCAYWTTPPGLAHYIASKAGVMGLTHALAEELGPYGITVNSVAPGMIPIHEMNAQREAIFAERLKHQPIKRLGTPEDVAEAVLYLAGESAGYVSGQCLLVNGGFTKL